jgi:NAD(P)H-flavin reductase
LVCIAGGTGLAPIKAVIEELAHEKRSRWLHLFVGARDRDDLYDLPALRRMAGRYPWLSVVTACSEDTTYDGEQGNICDVVERFGPWEDREFIVCGSPSMVRVTLGTLARMGVDAEHTHYDGVVRPHEPAPVCQ